MTFDQTNVMQPTLTWVHGGAGTTAFTTPIKMRLMTAVGSSTSNGTELATSGSYVALTGITPTSWAAVSGNSQATNTVLSQTNMPATTITGIELWDSNGTPKRVELGTLTASRTTSSGDTLSFASGAITSSMT